MKPRIYHIVAVALIVLLFGPTGTKSAAAACLTIDEVRAKNGWDIINELPDFEPYWFMDKTGSFAGMDVDLLNEVNKRLEIPETRYTTIPWEGVMPALLSKKTDFVPESITVTEERQKTFGFSHPYGDVAVVILTRPETGIKSAADLPGHVISAQTGSAAEAAGNKVRENFRAQGKDFELKSYQQTADELLDLTNKRVDAVLASRPPLATFMNKHPGKFVMAGLLDQPAYAAWLFRQEDMGDKNCIGYEINQVLSQLRKEGIILELQKKWLGQEFELPNY